jgi:hypothetical protein
MSDETPTVFISYQHGDGDLARELAGGLKEAGLAVWIDEEELLIGSSLIEQLATAVEGVDYFLALISPASINSRWCQKEISMALTDGIGREGVQVLPVRVGDVEMPATLRDQVYQQLDPDNLAHAVEKIVRDVRRYNERKHQIGAKAITEESRDRPRATPTREAQPAQDRSPGAQAGDDGFVPIQIVGVVKEGVTKPRNDGTRGSGLYRVPLRLSRRPPAEWSAAFPEAWNHPPSWSTMHRPGIGSIQGDTIVLDGTTMEELEQHHVRTLRLVVDDLNKRYAEAETQERARQAAQRRFDKSHRATVDDIADRLNFGSSDGR